MKFFGNFVIVMMVALSCVSFAAERESRTVLITGANRGIGLEFAKQFKAKGYHVIATTRKPGNAIALSKLDVDVEQLDVTDQQSVDKLALKLKNQPIDILINNAGILVERGKSIRDISPDRMLKSFAVNSVGPIRVIKALLPNIEASRDKTIINISSRLGSIDMNKGDYRVYSYGASKAALNHLNRTLAGELQSKGVKTVVIHPGWVRTDMGGASATFTTEKSVSGIIKVIDSVDQSKSGQFFDLHGKSLPW